MEDDSLDSNFTADRGRAIPVNDDMRDESNV